MGQLSDPTWLNERSLSGEPLTWSSELSLSVPPTTTTTPPFPPLSLPMYSVHDVDVVIVIV